MELKNFQRNVISDVAKYLAFLPSMSAKDAFAAYWEEKGVPLKIGDFYKETLPDVPTVCVKVPTGGGKTFIAASSIATIFDSLPYTKTKAVVWLVPSDSILEQTAAALKSPSHPYRLRINTDFQHRVQVYEKSELLNGQNFSPTSVVSQLSIFVLSYDSFRTSKKEGRKAYQENGYLAAFAEHWGDKSLLLADTDETALINVIRRLSPVIIVDESHHAVSTLSKEMLANFNPSFVLELTATPKKDANIISYVDAMQLKRENMVKLPVIVYNMRTKNEVIGEAIFAQRKLEAEAKAEEKRTGRYIRPIVLFQAEPKGKDDNTTFEKLKKDLIEANVPESHIAIKTADVNELRGVDLLSKNCPIRYIITVNALKEGWDCPFAYVLATIANRSSAVDVEQILGRVLRLPYTHRNTSNRLNISYVVTSSDNFQATLANVVKGLNSAGFSEDSYRAEDFTPEPDIDNAVNEIVKPEPEAGNATNEVVTTPTLGEVVQAEDDIPVLTESDKEEIIARINQPVAATEIFSVADRESNDFEKAVENSPAVSFPIDLQNKIPAFTINSRFEEEIKLLKLPQFVVENDIPMITTVKTALLTKEELAFSGDFTLHDKDARIDFATIEAEIAQVDLSQDDSYLPKAWKLSGMENRHYRKWFSSVPPEKRIAESKKKILELLSKMDGIDNGDLADYIERVIKGLTAEQMDDLQQAPHGYYLKIKRKIEKLVALHREEVFDSWVEQGKITCEPRYEFPSMISPRKFTKTLPHTLYTAEEEMNNLEHDVAWELSNMPNIKWWHRNISGRGFKINGFENTYPDIIAMTQSGKILVIEPKGDHLDNANSKQKVKLGRIWQNQAGVDYRYYMVFRDKDLDISGAFRFDKFLEIVRGL